MKKRMLSIALAFTMLFTCVGCQSTAAKNAGIDPKNETLDKISAEDAANTDVLKIGDETIKLNYMYLYAIQFLYTYKYTEGSMEDSMNGYKDQIISQLRTDEIKYQYAKSHGLELTDEQMKEMDDVVERYYKTFDEEFLSQYGITKDTVKELFTKQRYITELHDQTQADLIEANKKEFKKQLGDKKFYELYYLLFPTVEYGDDGKPVTDDKGKYTELDKDAVNKAKKNAEEAKGKLEDGEKPEDLAKEYGIEAYSDTLKSYEGAYSKELENLIKDLKNDEISEVYKDDMGYMVVKMINDDASDYRDDIIEASAESKASDDMSTVEQLWLQSVKVDEVNDFIGDIWKNLDISKISNDMQSRGLIKE